MAVLPTIAVVAAGDQNQIHPDAVVVIPIKEFSEAKHRLSESMAPSRRDSLARWMATRVLTAAAPLGVIVVCDSEDVASWSRDKGAAVAWTPGLDLNGALTAALEKVAGAGIHRAIIAHADLPFAANLQRFTELGAREIAIVPDRRRDGTNVMSVPARTALDLQYGPGSFSRHRTAAGEAGLTVTVIEDEGLGWDVDEPEDLFPPDHLGNIPF